MEDVYRFINHYGMKISKWGLENKIKEYEANRSQTKQTLTN